MKRAERIGEECMTTGGGLSSGNELCGSHSAHSFGIRASSSAFPSLRGAQSEVVRVYALGTTFATRFPDPLFSLESSRAMNGGVQCTERTKLVKRDKVKRKWHRNSRRQSWRGEGYTDVNA